MWDILSTVVQSLSVEVNKRGKCSLATEMTEHSILHHVDLKLELDRRPVQSADAGDSFKMCHSGQICVTLVVLEKR